MRLRGPHIDPDRQPRLWGIVAALVVIVAYLVAFVVENSKQVSVHFVLFTTHTSVIWVILLSLAIGLAVGILVSQLERRRRRRNERS